MPVGRAKDIDSVELVLTSSCNLDCAYCYQNAKAPGRMSWNTLRAAVDLLVKSPSKEVTLSFYGGEPLLQFPLVRRAVAYAERVRPATMQIRYILTTNGTLLDDRTAAFLADHEMETHLSFDGVPASQALRGRDTFAKLDALLDRVRETRPSFFERNLTVNIIFVAATIPYLAASVKYFLSKGVRKISLGPSLTYDPGWRRNSIDQLDRQFRSIYFSSLRHYRRTAEIPLGVLLRGEAPGAADRKINLMCGAGSGRTLTVDVDGQVYGCVMFAESYQEPSTELLKAQLAHMKLPRLRTRAFSQCLPRFAENARNARILTNKREKYSSYGKCRSCEFLAACSVCPVSIGHQPGNSDPNRIPDPACAYNLVSLKHQQRFSARVDAWGILSGNPRIPESVKDLIALTSEVAGEERGSAERTGRRR